MKNFAYLIYDDLSRKVLMTSINVAMVIIAIVILAMIFKRLTEEKTMDEEDLIDCDFCKYYDEEEGICGAFECNGIDYPVLPCEEEGTEWRRDA